MPLSYRIASWSHLHATTWGFGIATILDLISQPKGSTKNKPQYSVDWCCFIKRDSNCGEEWLFWGKWLNLFPPLRGSSILKCQYPCPKITMPANAVHQAAHVFMKNTVLIETWICTLTDAPGARKLSKLVTSSLRSNPFLRFMILRILDFQIAPKLRIGKYIIPWRPFSLPHRAIECHRVVFPTCWTMIHQHEHDPSVSSVNPYTRSSRMTFLKDLCTSANLSEKSMCPSAFLRPFWQLKIEGK